MLGAVGVHEPSVCILTLNLHASMRLLNVTCQLVVV
jgi:hypothetical protein